MLFFTRGSMRLDLSGRTVRSALGGTVASIQPGFREADGARPGQLTV